MKYFKTKAECLQHLRSLTEHRLLEESPSTPERFYSHETYCLHHGEYERPDYVPRLYKKGWAVCRLTHYYKGIFGAPPAATPCELVVVEDWHGQKYLECLWED